MIVVEPFKQCCKFLIEGIGRADVGGEAIGALAELLPVDLFSMETVLFHFGNGSVEDRPE